jgi:hypothetical protein
MFHNCPCISQAEAVGMVEDRYVEKHPEQTTNHNTADQLLLKLPVKGEFTKGRREQ